MTTYIDAVDPSLPLLDQLVGDGRPFADYEALAKSKYENALHSRNLETEQATLRADLETRMNYEEFLEQFRTTAPTKGDNHALPTGQDKTTTPPTITSQDIERIVEQREQRLRTENNLNTALSKYAEVNGPNHASKLKQQASDLAMSEQQLKEMAAANPKAFYRLTGIGETIKVDNFQPPPRTSVNSESFVPVGNTSREAQYFKDLYKKDVVEYYKPAVQNKIHDGIREGRFTLEDII